ncbi:MAG: KTSC domain-containing protein [Kiritimatiellia bacterium]|jgi:hypothetical protein
MKKFALILAVLLVGSVAAWAVDIEMQTVESSFLQKVGYDAATQTLAVQMVNSSDIYTYLNVPQSVYDGLMAAESKGAYYVRNIKGQFETDKVE